MSQVSDWAKEAKRHFLNPELLQQLFVREGGFLSACSSAELKILYRRWGQEMFEAVAGDRFSSKLATARSDLPWTVVETGARKTANPTTGAHLERTASRAARWKRTRRVLAASARPFTDVAVTATRALRLIAAFFIRLDARKRASPEAINAHGREWAMAEFAFQLFRGGTIIRARGLVPRGRYHGPRYWNFRS
ncbi:MAG TPA: hypothetical protein VFT13_07775 [Candidatus Krumholzibacteria bacterium]|nr:hypothetical protein [Candidatus Krumholzibacteria bacterium]